MSKKKSAAKKKRKPAAAKSRKKSTRGASPTGAAVRVRVARLGFGECALLTFPGGSGGQFNVLIDCGESTGEKQADTFTREVVSDIAASTKGRIDLLVVSNLQADHVTGFVRAQDEFDKIEINDVWLAWTANRDDQLASTLLAERQRLLEAIVIGSEVCGVEEEQLTTPGAASSAVAPILDALKRVLSRATGTVKYLKPGERHSLAGVKGVSAYVLGPPESETFLKRSLPHSQEVYSDALSALGVGDLGGDVAGAEAPFDEHFRVEPKDARHQKFFRERFGFKKDDELEWRRIGGGGLTDLSPLAMKVDGDANNTSLALAFQLEKSGKVLLLPSDAQVGNWLSWEGLDMKDANGNKITSKNLLKDTVLMKVGQYGSLTATPKDVGLELMTSDDLVAIVPADRQMAAKKRWQLPAEPLLARLIEKTCGRVILTDRGKLPSPAELDLSVEDQRLFADSHRVTRLYVESVVSM